MMHLVKGHYFNNCINLVVDELLIKVVQMASVVKAELGKNHLVNFIGNNGIHE